MRILMVCLMTCAGLHAQAPLSGEEALKKFRQKLESFGRATHVRSALTAPPAAKVCAIPLLKVSAATQDLDPKMLIVPKGDDRTHFHILQVTPPAPPCDEGNVSWKK